MRKLNRYVIHPFMADGCKKYVMVDKEYPRVKYPLFDTRRDAETFRAGMYGLTPEELKELKARKKNESKNV